MVRSSQESAVKHSVPVWVWFLVCLFVFGLAATPLSRLADILLWFALVAAVIVMSVLKLCAIWKHRHDPAARAAWLTAGPGAVIPAPMASLVRTVFPLAG
jgi:hypothetical protein